MQNRGTEMYLFFANKDCKIEKLLSDVFLFYMLQIMFF